jgi:hypothetical protein
MCEGRRGSLSLGPGGGRIEARRTSLVCRDGGRTRVSIVERDVKSEDEVGRKKKRSMALVIEDSLVGQCREGKKRRVKGRAVTKTH